MALPTSALKTTVTGYAQYKGREGQYAFLLHRLTGLGTLLFLIIHILDTATVYFFPSLYVDAIAIYRSTPFMLGEIGLVFSVIYHGVNGLRIAVTDLWLPEKWTIRFTRNAVRVTLLLSLLLWAPAAAWMMISLLDNNFGINILGMLGWGG
ncbi:MAG: succinate dehydrogenase, cytochrome b556 subunit [Chloroflexi bacterium]|nr:succinate dehydrogenase, cytochrome b556 subunit [Chloroflexota bacterium]